MATDTSLLQRLPEPHVGPLNFAQFAHRQVDAGDISGFADIHLFAIPAGAYVFAVNGIISEGFTASTTVQIGDGDDPDGYIDVNDWTETSAARASSLAVSNGVLNGGKLYSSGGTIILQVAGATPSAGTIDVWAVYALLPSGL